MGEIYEMIEFEKEVKIYRQFSVMPREFVENYIADVYDEKTGSGENTRYYVVFCPEDSDDSIKIPMRYFYAENYYGRYVLRLEPELLIKGLRKYLEHENNGYFFDYCGYELFLTKHCGFIVQNPDDMVFHYVSGEPRFNEETETWEPINSSLVYNLGKFEPMIASELSKKEVK